MKFNLKIASIIVALNFIFVFAPLQLAIAQQSGGGSFSPNGGSAVSANGGGSKSANGGGSRVDKILNPIGSGDLQTFLKNILRIFILLGTMVVVFFIIYAGLQYVLARGDEGAIKKAHSTLTWTIVGAAILLGAEAISLVISNTVQELAK